MEAMIDFRLVGAGVYRITCLATGTFYIGSTNDFARRWQQHRDQLNARRHPNYKLQRDWNRYGERQFEFSIVERTDPQLRLKREQFYIDHYRVTRFGYNINPKAEGAPDRVRMTGRYLVGKMRHELGRRKR